MNSVCLACKIWVFDLLPGYSQAGFAGFLSRRPRFFDGTRSFAPANVGFCPSGPLNQTVLCDYTGSYTVRDYILGTAPNSGAAEAKAQTPADQNQGMQVFFNPSTGICNVLSVPNPGSGDTGVLNQATLFHEALHGFTGSQDVTLQSAFHLSTLPAPSFNITDYLEGKAIPGGAFGARSCN